MPRLDRLTFRRALLAGAACVLATLSCGREVTGPPDGLRIVRGFTFEARFGPEGLPNGVASDLVPFTKVRVVLVNAAGTRVVDRVVDFPSNVQEVPLSFDVPLASGSGSAGESMSLSLAFVNAAGDTVFRGGPQPVQVVPNVPGSEPPPVPQIPVTFTGTGAAATSVVISRSADTVLAGNAFSYSAVALDGQGSPIAGTPIAWRSATPTRATITAPGAGAGTTLASRGPALIIAQLLSAGAQADTVLLEVLPRAGALAGVSGSGQSAPVGSLLSQPVVVRVNATDGLPMAGVTVNFSAANGGSVGTASALTNASGLAQTTWTLGGAAGAQTLTATSTGLSGSPLAISATATAPVVSLIHHYPFNTDLNDIVGTENGTFGGTNNAIANQVLAFGGTNGYVEYGSQIVPNTGSYSVSLFVRNRLATGLVEYISQGASLAPGFYIGSNGTQLRVSDQWQFPGEPAPALDGLFHHLALVVDSIANQSLLYVDGTLRQTLAQRIATPAGGTNTRLGRQFGGLGEFMDGDIDELRVYSGAINAAQVAALHAAGVTAPDRLVFGTQPTTVTVLAPIAPAITVRVEDALGRLRTTFNGNVTLSLDQAPVEAILAGTTTVAAVGGIATFANLTVDQVGSTYRLRATAAGSTNGISATFTANPPSATRLVFTDAPTNTVQNAQILLMSVTATDALGNPATGFTGPITISIGNNPGGAALAGTITVNAIGGVALFGDLSLNNAGVGYTLVAASPGLTSATSTAFNITAAPATQLTFTVQPSTALTGASIAPAVVVTARDALGNVATGYTGTVTVAMGANPGGATLSGTLAVAAVAGVATFGNLSLNNAGSGYTLVASAPGLTGATSSAFSITASVFANTWTNVSGGTWSTASNWSLGRAPIAADTVVIALPGTYTVTMDVNYTGSIMLVGGGTGTQTLAVGVRTLTVTEVLSVQPTGALTLNGAGVIAGAGTVSNQGTITTTAGTVSATLLNSGMIIAQGNTTISGTLTVAPTATLSVLGSNAGTSANLTVTAGFTNTGLIELTNINSSYAATLTVASGTLVNAPSGTISVLPSLGGNRTLAARLDNQGTVNVVAALTLTQASAAHVNSGTINLTSGNLTVTQTGTSPSFTNTGTIALTAARVLTVGGGLLDLQAGLVTGFSSFLVTTGAPTVRFLATTVQPRVTFSAGTVLPDPFVIGAGDSLRINDGTFAPPSLTNNGLLTLEGVPTLTTAYTMAPTATLRVQGNGTGGNASATFTNGFTNPGLIELTNITSSYAATLTVAGTLVNASTGTLAVLPGVAIGPRTLVAGLLDNFGTLNADASLALSAPVNQRGAVTVLASRTLTIGGLLSLYPGSTTNVFGTLVKSGTCTNLGGTIGGGGTGATCP